MEPIDPPITYQGMDDQALVDHLRRAASIWFKNSDLLLLEELIRRYVRLGSQRRHANLEQSPVE